MLINPVIHKQLSEGDNVAIMKRAACSKPTIRRTMFVDSVAKEHMMESDI